MIILALCSALNNSYLAININGKIVSKMIKSDKNYHSLYLVEEIKKIIEENNLKMENINAITVNAGPGSFTGIRVALTVAKVIAGELNIPIIPLNTSEILLRAFSADYYLSDARRDMYFVGTKDDIKMIQKDKFQEFYPRIKNSKIICDSRLSKEIDNSICYEEQNKDLGKTMLELAQDKFEKSTDKTEFNPVKTKANYIQTPPVF